MSEQFRWSPLWTEHLARLLITVSRVRSPGGPPTFKSLSCIVLASDSNLRSCVSTASLLRECEAAVKGPIDVPERQRQHLTTAHAGVERTHDHRSQRRRSCIE